MGKIIRELNGNRENGTITLFVLMAKSKNGNQILPMKIM